MSDSHLDAYLIWASIPFLPVWVSWRRELFNISHSPAVCSILTAEIAGRIACRIPIKIHAIAHALHPQSIARSVGMPPANETASAIRGALKCELRIRGGERTPKRIIKGSAVVRTKIKRNSFCGEEIFDTKVKLEVRYDWIATFCGSEVAGRKNKFKFTCCGRIDNRSDYVEG
jgi:hypothetical protein